MTNNKKSIIIVCTAFFEKSFGGGIIMKRRYRVSVLDDCERKISITGDMFPIEVVNSEDGYVSFELYSNVSLPKNNILFEEREEEIYFTLWKDIPRAKGNIRSIIEDFILAFISAVFSIRGCIRAIIPGNHDFIICHKKFTCRYEFQERTFKVIYWDNGKRITKFFTGNFKKILVGDEQVKITFEDRVEII